MGGPKGVLGILVIRSVKSYSSAYKKAWKQPAHEIDVVEGLPTEGRRRVGSDVCAKIGIDAAFVDTSELYMWCVFKIRK